MYNFVASHNPLVTDCQSSVPAGKDRFVNKCRFAQLIVATILIASLFLVPEVIRAGNSSLHLSDLTASQNALNSIVMNRVPASFDASINFNGVPLMYGESSGCYYYSLTGGDYDPEVRLGGQEKLNIIFLKNGITSDSIRTNTAQPFLLYDDHRYQECKLIITTLPLMSIGTDAEMGQKDMPALMQLYDNASGNMLQSNAHIRIRGGSSQGYPKKSYRLSLKTQAVSPQHLPLLGLRNDDDWILYAAYNEPEKLRNALATTMWKYMGAGRNSFGISLGSDCRFVELFVNGSYTGLYLLMTPVDAKQIRLKENADPARCEYLYRSISYVQTSTPDFLAASNATVAGRYELREPDGTGNTYIKWQPLDALNSLTAGGSDEEFASEVFTMTEQSNLVDYWIFINTVYAEDNVEKNINLAAKYHNDRYVILMGAWDLDLTFGNYYTEDEDLCCRVDARLSDANLWNSSLMQRALELNAGGMREAIAERWEELRSGVLSEEAILSRLYLLDQDVYGSGAILRDHERWPGAAFTPDTSALAQFIRKRLVHMDRYIAEIDDGLS